MPGRRVVELSMAHERPENRLYPAAHREAPSGARGGARELDLEHQRRLEVGFVALRWFVVAFGVVEAFASVRGDPSSPAYVAPVGFVLIALLAIGNVSITFAVEAARTRRRMQLVGVAAFTLDIAVLTALVWTFMNSPSDSAWVVIFILPLEGAIRYQVKGALVPVVVTLVSQCLRELSFHYRFPSYRADFAAVAFRIGVELVIAVVAGIMARSFREEMLSAADRARAAEEAADLAETAMQRLHELDEMKSDFVAITSHELRSPLAAVRGFVDTLLDHLDALDPEEVREFLVIIDQQSARLARLVEDLLVVSRIDAGQVTLDPAEVDLPAVLMDTVQGLGEEAARVQMQLSYELPRSMWVDANRLDQVLRNLLHNALKFSLPGAPVVLSAAVDATILVVSVADEGVGVPPEERTRIFERFHQAESANTRKAEGAGLGLYITRRLVEAMDGTIEVASALGEGSTFTVRLPVRSPTAPARRSGAARAG
jgi:signal transduction histidine kinase